MTTWNAKMRAVQSVPADPSRISFLSLPAEIRNEIYKILFEHPDPLRITGEKPSLFRRAGDSNINLIVPKSRRYFKSYSRVNTIGTQNRETEPIRFEPFHLVRVYQPGLGLFAVCKQIWQEASTTFYSNNAFVITKRMQASYYFGHDKCGDFIGCANHWLRQIEIHAHTLRQLTIDLDSICPDDCTRPYMPERSEWYSQGWLDFGPLPVAVWDMNLKIDLVVVQPFSLAHEYSVCQAHDHRGNTRFDEIAVCNVNALNNLLRSLYRDDLRLKRYGRLVTSIFLARDGSNGIVFFDSTHSHELTPCQGRGRTVLPGACACRHSKVYFSAKNGTNPYVRAKQPPTLMTLPIVLRDRIIELAVLRKEFTKISLDSSTKFKEAFGIIYTNRELYSKFRNRCFTLNIFHLELVSTEMRSTFMGFQGLRHFLELRCSFAQRVPNTHVSDYRIEIHLNFQLRGPASLSDVRFSIIPLLLTVYGPSGPSHATLRISIFQVGRDGAPIATTTIEMEHLLRKACRKLSDRYDYGKSHGNELCPDIWINGRGWAAQCVSRGEKGNARKGGRFEWFDYNASGGRFPHDGLLQDTWWYLQSKLNSP